MTVPMVTVLVVSNFKVHEKDLMKKMATGNMKKASKSTECIHQDILQVSASKSAASKLSSSSKLTALQVQLKNNTLLKVWLEAVAKLKGYS